MEGLGSGEPGSYAKGERPHASGTAHLPAGPDTQVSADMPASSEVALQIAQEFVVVGERPNRRGSECL